MKNAAGNEAHCGGRQFIQWRVQITEQFEQINYNLNYEL